jgi:nicotinate-nucleotide pyrophosphorylase (carboxylating)
MKNPFHNPAVYDLVNLAIREDCPYGDLTTNLALKDELKDKTYSAFGVAKEPGLFSGGGIIQVIKECLRSDFRVERLSAEGTSFEKGDVLFELHGPASELLQAERLILNFCSHLSGIATLTASYVEELKDTNCVIVDTRKTRPGFRHLEKLAVLAGGALNHRMNLSESILLKDNHFLAAKELFDFKRVLERVVEKRSAHQFLEVEVQTIEEFSIALDQKVNMIMLDNFSKDEIEKAIELKRRSHREDLLVEVSGGIRKENIRELASLGVDRISVGGIIHQARWLDFGLDFKL